IAKYGVVRGIAMGTERLLRCHPFSAGGSDPLP
ncbi:MAG: putative rane protein insertion efficiency factor, partial [Chloroflexota bacterium]